MEQQRVKTLCRWIDTDAKQTAIKELANDIERKLEMNRCNLKLAPLSLEVSFDTGNFVVTLPQNSDNKFLSEQFRTLSNYFKMLPKNGQVNLTVEEIKQ